jgi:hypothetical protein
MVLRFSVGMPRTVYCWRAERVPGGNGFRRCAPREGLIQRFVDETEVLGCGLHGNERHGGIQYGGADRVPPDSEPTCRFDAGNVEQIVHQPQQQLPTAERIAQNFFLLFGSRNWCSMGCANLLIPAGEHATGSRMMRNLRIEALCHLGMIALAPCRDQDF